MGAHASASGSAQTTRSSPAGSRQASTWAAIPSVRRESWSSPSALPSIAEASAARASTSTRAALDRDLLQAPATGWRRDRAEQAIAGVRDSIERVRGVGLVGIAAGALDVEREAVEARARHAAAEPGCGCLLEPMGLVEDDGVVVGQDAAARGDVGEVERVVRDHELGLGGPSARGLGEAARKERAATARAPVGADGELGPERVGGLEGELGAVPGLGL